MPPSAPAFAADQLEFRRLLHRQVAGLDTVQVLTRSEEDTRLQFDLNGGIRELKDSEQPIVLTEAMVRRLARAAQQIKSVFAGRDQDIEWVYAKGRLYIVQSRPYIESN